MTEIRDEERKSGTEGRERLSLLQKIDTLLVMRRKGKADFVKSVGVSRGRISRCSAGNGNLTCAEVQRIARYFEARVRVRVVTPEGATFVRDLVSDSEDAGVYVGEIEEMLGVECELEFVLDDLNKII